MPEFSTKASTDLIERMERVEHTTRATPPATAAALTQMVRIALPIIENEAVDNYMATWCTYCDASPCQFD